ncbi:hypothetical protein [Streptomyces sp. KL116D]|uniref:hypothetical protein n=1 Tax=Streptomyces sp. KL116D TaxID=3045152 RepID=UPI0035580A30
MNEATQPDEQEETSMPKITVHGGPSIEGADVDPDSGDVTPADETAKDEDTTAESETAEQPQRSRRGRKNTTAE